MQSLKKKETTPQKSGNVPKKHGRYAMRIAWILLLLAAWELGVRISGVSALLVPSPVQVFRTLIHDLTKGNLLAQTFFSLAMILGALFVSLLLALLFCVLAELHPFSEALIDVLGAVAHPLPGVALMPLIILWFGTGTGAIFAILVHASLWPLLLHLLTGISRTPVIYTDIGKSLSMSRWRILFEIRLRYALPDILSGLKTGFARAWRAFISAEMIFGAAGESGGLGTYILTRRTFMDTSGLFAGIVLIALTGLLTEQLLFRVLEQKTVVKWGLRQ